MNVPPTLHPGEKIVAPDRCIEVAVRRVHVDEAGRPTRIELKPPHTQAKKDATA